MLSVNNLSFIQKFNNRQFEGQKFQQSPVVSPASRILQHDTVSFGMTQREISRQFFSEIKPLAQEFISHLKSGSDSEAIEIMDSLAPKHFELKNAFALYRTEDGNSLMGLAIKHRPTMAPVFLDYVKTLHHSAQEDFALFGNSEGDTHFTLALKEEHPDIAESFLDFVSGLSQNTTKKKFVKSRTFDSKDNQFNIAVSLGYHDTALKFLDLVRNIGGKTPTKFFALLNKNRRLPLDFVMGSGNDNLIDAFLGFYEEAVQKDTFQEILLKELEQAKSQDGVVQNPLFLGQLLQGGRLDVSRPS